MLDFDGPVCRLFGGSPAGKIALDMRRYLATLGPDGTGPRGPERGAADDGDPHRMLSRFQDRKTAAALERILAAGEEAAAESAFPTPGAAAFIRNVHSSGRALAMTTNNAPGAALRYLKQQALDDCFEGRVFGRDPDDPGLMKPHPDCLLRAMAAMGVRADECLAIGDSPRDAAAAKAAGVPFLGYARSEDRVARLRQVDPHPVVVGMHGLASAAGKLRSR